MGPKSKMEKQNHYEEFDDNQMEFALLMDDKKQMNKDNEKLHMAFKVYKEDLAKQWNTTDKSYITTNTDNTQNKKPADKSNRPFDGHSNAKNWVDDESISSDDRKLRKLKKKSNSSHKDNRVKWLLRLLPNAKLGHGHSETSFADDTETNMKETMTPAKNTYSTKAQKLKQQSERPKDIEVSTDADEDSKDEVVTSWISKPNLISSNRDFQPLIEFLTKK